jgi:hypothetical protein
MWPAMGDRLRKALSPPGLGVPNRIWRCKVKMMLSARKRRGLSRVSIFLITIALIAGMAGCGGGGGNGDGDGNGNGGEFYTLVVDGTAGGAVAVDNVIIPGKAMFLYDPGTVVNLNATPDAGYRFVNWTGNVSAIADVNAAVTDITMDGSYNITANFVPQ